MKIAILGTGMVGKTIASRLADLGNDVTIGTRNIEKTLSTDEKDLNGKSSFKEWIDEHSNIKVDTFSNAASNAEIIFNCTSGMISINALNLAGLDNLAGKLLIDIANPLDFSNGMPPSLNPANTDSLGEQIQKAFPETKVVKTLNTMNAYLMVDPSKLKGDHNVFLCGNDSEAKKTTKTILNSFGWKDDQIIDLGDITNARGTEMLLPIWLRLWNALGTPEFNFHIQKN
ncbi:NAD(P)-binding domain-containing protein [Paracrocinitomix mangrovi]|uniref:NADPH-dependent F420 reductase n=1 Tax=Paracrocinitomix mangrovi TaxID=2862509 RepID=UPI001C8E2DAB|nr:NAD(P)-binding domain-containing protein [Paracrocinitomix mangrovi]UKN03834.1 NAD(P)-binding domain-containing protein [Paracrocinitomix mangrovi]